MPRRVKPVPTPFAKLMTQKKKFLKVKVKDKRKPLPTTNFGGELHAPKGGSIKL